MFLRKAIELGDLTRGMLSLLRSFSRFFERLGRWCAGCAWLTHLLFAARSYSSFLGINVSVESRFHGQHFHRLREAFARSAGPLALATTPDIRAQKDALRPLSAAVLGLGAGGFKLLPVAALYRARPLAVRPAPLLTGSFSPRPTAKDTLFFIG